MQMIRTILPALLLAAALGADAASAQEPRHHHLAPDLDAFHAVLAPAWHAEADARRSPDACAKVGDLEARAKDIRSTDPSALVAAVGAMKLKCQSQPGNVDAAFADVHDAFHRLMEGRGGK
jgi:hypothetical protein